MYLWASQDIIVKIHCFFNLHERKAASHVYQNITFYFIFLPLTDPNRCQQLSWPHKAPAADDQVSDGQSLWGDAGGQHWPGPALLPHTVQRWHWQGWLWAGHFSWEALCSLRWLATALLRWFCVLPHSEFFVCWLLACLLHVPATC